MLLELASARGSAGDPREETPDRRLPNIVLVLADDLGWGSVGAYGADPALVRTPHIDRLAAEGVLFRDASAPSSVCSPTRYALLTGRYAWRAGLASGALGIRSPLLPDPAQPTLATLMRQVGYRTAIIGKWHLGFGRRPRVDYTGRLDPGPLELGFNHFFGLPSNHGDRTGVYVEGHRVAGLRSERRLPSEQAGVNFAGRSFLGLDAPLRVDEEVMGDLTDRAIDWLGEQRREQPFFLLLSQVAVHRPVTPSEATAGTSAAGPYGDWIHEADLSVGRVLEALDALGIADETLVIVTSDNGGVVEDNEKLDATRALSAGLLINGPYRGGKRSVFEGGFRVPFVARWPGRIEPGAVSDEMISLVDLLATLDELANASPSEGSRQARDSVSFLPALLGKQPRDRRGSMVLHAGDGNFAVRWGRWKWIEGVPDPDREGSVAGDRPDEHRPQLYDLLRDPTESRDLIEEFPEVARLMARMLEGQKRDEAERHPTLGL